MSGARYWASGDSHAGGDIARFDQLFPLGHAYFGIADVVARQNVIAASAGLSLRPLPALTAELDVHPFRRAGRADGLFNAGGGLLRAGNPNASRVTSSSRPGPHRDIHFSTLFTQFTF